MSLLVQFAVISSAVSYRCVAWRPRRPTRRRRELSSMTITCVFELIGSIISEDARCTEAIIATRTRICRFF